MAMQDDPTSNNAQDNTLNQTDDPVPSDVPGATVPPDHPALDDATNTDSDELYHEGAASAAGVEPPADSAVTGYTPPSNQQAGNSEDSTEDILPGNIDDLTDDRDTSDGQLISS